jgi:DNA-binding transcriptional regulator YiaG
MTHKVTDGTTLKAWRIGHRVSQNKMAQLMDVTPDTLRDWERGKAKMHADDCAKAEAIFEYIHSTQSEAA